MSVQHFLHNIKKQTSNYYEDYGKPSRTTWQQLNKYKVHVLGMQKWPEKLKEVAITKRNF